MWVVMDDGNAVENRTGDELYTDYIKGIVNVYRNEKKIAWFTSLPDARAFIKKTVEEMNSVVS